MKYFISRQHYCTGVQMVEIAEGGMDYSNPDMLVEKYPGEGTEYDNPAIAVEKAIEIHKAWLKDQPDEDIQIGQVSTGGWTCEAEESNYRSLRTWAKNINHGNR